MNCILLYMPLIVIQFDNFWDQELWNQVCVHCAKSQPIFLIYQHAGPKEVIFEAAAAEQALSVISICYITEQGQHINWGTQTHTFTCQKSH